MDNLFVLNDNFLLTCAAQFNITLARQVIAALNQNKFEKSLFD